MLMQTLLIAGSDAIHLTLDPDFTQKASGPTAGRANVQCLFNHSTIAARDACVYLPEVKLAGPPAEPVIVQSRDCGFYNLFPGRTHRPGLVRYERGGWRTACSSGRAKRTLSIAGSGSAPFASPCSCPTSRKTTLPG